MWIFPWCIIVFLIFWLTGIQKSLSMIFGQQGRGQQRQSWRTGKCLRRPNSLNLASALHKTGFYLPTSCFSMDQALLTIFSILEFQTLPQPWISGLFADLLWLRSILPDSTPEHWTTDLTEAIEFWQKGAPGWKALIKRAGRTHLMQEAMMIDVHKWHRKFFQTPEKQSASFEPAFLGRVGGDGDYHCFCGRHFDTAQGLFTHKRKAHGVFSQEHDLLTGATCPVCMTHFWTTQRLQQHLAYISRRTGRNACYQVLRKSWYLAEYERTKLPLRVLGMNRIEAIPTEGPAGHFPPQQVAQIQSWQKEIDSLKAA